MIRLESEKSCRYKIFHSGCFASKRRRHLRIPSENIVDFRALIHKALKFDFSSRCRSGERHVVKTAERKCMRILDELKGCGSIGISGHENPDGDCAGSCMGMALFLRKAISSSSSITGGADPSSSSALWQKGQRISQPPKKTVHATRPGKSSSVIFCNPCIFIYLILFYFHCSHMSG